MLAHGGEEDLQFLPPKQPRARPHKADAKWLLPSRLHGTDFPVHGRRVEIANANVVSRRRKHQQDDNAERTPEREVTPVPVLAR